MRISSNRFGRVALGIAALSSLALIAAACGDDDDGGSSPTSIPSGGTTAPTKAAEATNTTAATATKAATSPTAAASASSAASPTTGAATNTTIQVSSAGSLTDGAGFTLYTFDSDQTAGKSSCNGQCATNWPPALTTATSVPAVAGASGSFTIITRDDGTKQIAYKDKPLYRYIKDTAAGQTTGDGVGDVWHTAKP